MRHVGDLAHGRALLQALPRGAILSWREAQPVHARVHLEIDAVGAGFAPCRQPVELGSVVHHVPEVEALAKLQVIGAEAAFQQQNRPTPAQGAQGFGFSQVEQGEAVGRAQRRESALDAMPIGMGLDHRPHLGLRRGQPCAGQIVGQCLGVDGG
jgi:hypothetical protein